MLRVLLEGSSLDGGAQSSEGAMGECNDPTITEKINYHKLLEFMYLAADGKQRCVCRLGGGCSQLCTPHTAGTHQYIDKRR